ncbi:MAG: hypothetical protein WC156_09330 [Pedobacter sp.]
MRTKHVAVIVAGLLALAGTALAGPWGCGGGRVQGTVVSVEAVKKFQDETTALRNEMMLKKVELHNEYLKQPVDETRIAVLTRENTDLQSRITTIAASHGLPGPDGGCGMGGKMGMGRGMGRIQTACQNR